MSNEARVREITHSLSDVRTRITQAAAQVERRDDEITLIAVTKTYPVSDVEILRDLGVRNFGENRSAEGAEKSALVDGHWHFQGQIQSNKIAAISSWASTVHSLDDVSHVAKFDRAVSAIPGKRLQVFLQISLDGAGHRAGIARDELSILAEAVLATEHLDLVGIMAVPPVEADADAAFAEIATIAASFKEKFPMASYLSAGMSNDFEVAIAYGATHVRVGSQILGPRTYGA